MKRLSLLLVGITILLVSSCADKNAQERLDRLESKMATLEQRQNNMDPSSDIAALKSQISSLSAQLARLVHDQEERDRPVPLARELAQFMSDLSNRRQYKKYRMERDLSQDDLTFYLKDKETGDLVLFGQIVYQKDKSRDWFRKYSRRRIAGYPGKKTKNAWVQVLAGKFEVRVEASQERKDFQNTKKLIRFLRTIDLRGLKRFK